MLRFDEGGGGDGSSSVMRVEKAKVWHTCRVLSFRICVCMCVPVHAPTCPALVMRPELWIHTMNLNMLWSRPSRDEWAEHQIIRRCSKLPQTTRVPVSPPLGLLLAWWAHPVVREARPKTMLTTLVCLGGALAPTNKQLERVHPSWSLPVRETGSESPWRPGGRGQYLLQLAPTGVSGSRLEPVGYLAAPRRAQMAPAFTQEIDTARASFAQMFP